MSLEPSGQCELILCFQLVQNIVYSPLLVLKGIDFTPGHIFLIFSGDARKWRCGFLKMGIHPGWALGDRGRDLVRRHRGVQSLKRLNFRPGRSGQSLRHGRLDTSPGMRHTGYMASCWGASNRCVRVYIYIISIVITIIIAIIIIGVIIIFIITIIIMIFSIIIILLLFIIIYCYYYENIYIYIYTCSSSCFMALS